MFALYTTCTDEQLNGGTVSVLVKYRGIITVLNKVFQICNLAKAVQMTCPIDKGNREISVSEVFPSYAPSVSIIIATQSMHVCSPLSDLVQWSLRSLETLRLEVAPSLRS